MSLLSYLPVTRRSFNKLILEVLKIMTTQAELATEMAAVQAQLVKIGEETSSLLLNIIELTALVEAGGNITPELQAAVDAVKAQAQVVDDLVPDA